MPVVQADPFQLRGLCELTCHVLATVITYFSGEHNFFDCKKGRDLWEDPQVGHGGVPSSVEKIFCIMEGTSHPPRPTPDRWAGEVGQLTVS